MTEVQKKWYFYWRSQVRNGNYIQTDLSYIFVYIYELINDVGFNDPLDGYYKLNAVWQVYRGTLPKLDNYLPDWIFDFLILHKLNDKIDEFMQDCRKNRNPILLNIYIQKHYIEQNEPISVSDIKALASYQIEKSKFWQEGHAPIMREKTEVIFKKINTEMLNQYKKNLFQMFCPSLTVSKYRQCYISAVYDGTESYYIEYPDFVSHKPITEFIDSILRYTENKLREQTGFKGRLRGINIEDDWKRLIDSEFGTVVPELQERIQKRPATIHLQADEINKLRTESDELRELLSIEQQETEYTSQLDEKIRQMEPVIPIYSEKQLLTDLEEITALLRNCGTEKRRILEMLYNNDWEYGIAELSNSLDSNMADMMIDEINLLGMELTGTIIIATEQNRYVVEDDFRDEIEHIYTHCDLLEQTEQDLERDSEQDLFTAFLSGLNDFQLEILRLLAAEQIQAENLEQMALVHGTMPELVFDEINELFQAQVNDLIIDTLTDPPVIAEEYQAIIEKYLEKVANKI